MFNHEHKSYQEASDFVDSLSEEIVDAAWTAGFFVMADVEGYPEFLIPYVSTKKDKSWNDWLRRLKLFVASCRSDSFGDNNFSQESKKAKTKINLKLAAFSEPEN